MSSDNSNSSGSGNSCISLILFIISLVCYLNISDTEAMQCDVVEQKNYLLYSWIFQASLLGAGILMCCGAFFNICTGGNLERAQDCTLMIGYLLYIMNIIGFLVIIGILWGQDPYVYQFKLHDCINGNTTMTRSTIVTAVQVIPMIYTVIAWIIYACLAIMLCLVPCFFCGSDENKNNELKFGSKNPNFGSVDNI